MNDTFLTYMLALALDSVGAGFLGLDNLTTAGSDPKPESLDTKNGKISAAVFIYIFIYLVTIRWLCLHL
jgi:hypothetical protein